jgi:tetratricopeptide (TPR) repeat protein
MKVRQIRDKMDPKVRPAIPNEYQIQLAFARTNLELKHFDEAWKNLEIAGKENPKSADVLVYRGVYYLDQEKHQESLKELEKAVSLDNKNAYAYYYQGMAYFHSGVADKAVDAFKKFLELAPAAPEAAEAKRLINILC